MRRADGKSVLLLQAVAVVTLASLAFTLGTDAADAGGRQPRGMVRYAQPVYKNGRRVLWHGVWRGSAYSRHAPAAAAPVAAKAAATVAAAAAAAAAAASVPAKPFSIVADPDDLTANRMAREFAATVADKGAPGRAIIGPTSPSGLSRIARSGLADFAILSLDTAALAVKADANWAARTPLIAPLAPETMEVVASRDVNALADLEGKQVSAGDPESAAANSVRLLFQRLGVHVTPVYEPLTEGLKALAAGKRAALVVVGARESHTLDDFGQDGKFHLVAIPWAAAFEQVYAPARIGSNERPNLIAANDSVETVATPMALVALEAPAGSPRAEALGRTAGIFLKNYDDLLADERDPHWRDVNLAADASLLAGPWPRLAAVQSWLDDHKATSDASLDAFRASARTAASGGGPKADDSDRLYETLARWRGQIQ